MHWSDIVMNEVSYKPLIDDMTWSYSRVTSFEDCPYQWFLQYIREEPKTDKFYASYGSFVHSLLEKYYKGKADKDSLYLEFLADFQDRVVGDRPNASIVSKYINRGKAYFQNLSELDMDIIAVEKKVNFEVGGYPFIGYIDLLCKTKDGDIVIIDHKSADLKERSNRKKPTLKDKELDEKLRQLYLYSTAVKDEFGRFPKYLCFNCFRSGVFIKEEFNEENYMNACDQMLTNIKQIEKTEDFYPQIDYFYCKYLCGQSENCWYNEIMEEEKRRGSK